MVFLNNFVFILVVSFLLGCASDKSPQKKEETKPKSDVNLNSYKDSISYSLGYLKANSIEVSTKNVFARLNKSQLIQGFKLHLQGIPCDKSIDTVRLLFGATFQDFNPQYVELGSRCMGKMAGFSIYDDLRKIRALDDFNFEMIEKGFSDGIYGREIPNVTVEKLKQLKENYLKNIQRINAELMMEKAKSIKGIEVFDNGLLMETISLGKGPIPKDEDDIKVQYIETNALGDTLVNTYKSNKSLPIPWRVNSGEMPGITFALKHMHVGGIYRVFVPLGLSYGEAVCYKIELVDCGPKGSFTQGVKLNNNK